MPSSSCRARIENENMKIKEACLNDNFKEPFTFVHVISCILKIKQSYARADSDEHQDPIGSITLPHVIKIEADEC